MMNTAEQLKADTGSRNKIIHNINRNYFVEAGAGSGKTTVLVERMVAMVESGLDISKIAAITFTKAAANEFYARFQKRLIERSNEHRPADYIPRDNELANPTDETRANCRSALQNIDLAFMGTIDSFCNMVMSEHPSEGHIPSDASIISDEETDELYKREYARILNGEYHNTGLEEKARKFKHYTSHDVDDFITVLKTLLNHRDCELQSDNQNIPDLDQKFAQEKQTISKIVDVLVRNPHFFDIMPNAGKRDKLIANLNRYRYVFRSTFSWENNISVLQTALKNTFGDKDFRIYYNKEVADALAAGILYFEVGKVRNKDNHYQPAENLKGISTFISDNKYQVVLDFVKAAKEEILNTLRREGKLTFNDYLVYLRDTLKEDARNGGKLIRHIYERHSYFMIDEFQDTDPIQAEIFFYLAAKDISENWKECVPYQGSLFIVGDPKQSIYRFKNADVASFLRIKSMFEKPEIGEVLCLYCNFRSTYEIRSYFNRTFEPLMIESADQSAYPLIPTDSSEKKDDFTGVYQYEITPNDNKDPELEDNFKVKEMILKLVHNPKYKVRSKSGIRELEWKDFMIITPGKKALADYASIFRENGIPYYVEGNISFDECPSLEELIKIYAGITAINDNRYFYGALKSALFNISEKEILEAVAEGYVLNIHAGSDGLNLSEKMKDAIRTLQSFSAMAMENTPSAVFFWLIENSHVFETVGNRNMEYLYFALELLKARESSKEIISHADALGFFKELLSRESEQERCPGLRQSGNQVHLANLHKVKGLEAPVVILAKPFRKTPSADFRMIREETGNRGYLFAASPKNKTFRVIETEKYDDTYKKDEEASIEAESLRLAYVAATRARNVLIIASKKKKDSNLQDSRNPWKYLLAEEHPDIETMLSQEKKEQSGKGIVDLKGLGKTGCILNNENLKNESYIIRRPSSLTENEKGREMLEDDERTLKQQDEKGDSFATSIGTMVHRLMELVISSDDRFVKKELISQIINENRDNAKTFGTDICTDILCSVYETIHSGGYRQINGAKDDILPVLLKAEEKYCEVPFTYKEGNVIWNGIIDLLYKDDKGYHIIDWKTNKDGTGLAEHYKNQLEAYKKAIRESSGIDVTDALIYHIGIK